MCHYWEIGVNLHEQEKYLQFTCLFFFFQSRWLNLTVLKNEDKHRDDLQFCIDLSILLAAAIANQANVVCYRFSLFKPGWSPPCCFAVCRKSGVTHALYNFICIFCLCNPAKNRSQNCVLKMYTGMGWLICSTCWREWFCVHPFILSCNPLSWCRQYTYLTIDLFPQKEAHSTAVLWLNYIYISFCVNMLCELCHESNTCRNVITA